MIFHAKYHIIIHSLLKASTDECSVDVMNSLQNLQTNTFQCILATNGESSYVIFLYADGGIQWTTGDASDGVGGLGGTPAHVGLNAGDGINFVNVPGSETSSIINITRTSNVCKAGVWIFRVDDLESTTSSSSTGKFGVLKSNTTLTTSE